MTPKKSPTSRKIFLSHSRDDSCEASLLQFAMETLLKPFTVTVWSYQRDQSPTTRSVASTLKDQVKGSVATVFLASPSTIKGGASQWMELAYADAFSIPTYVLLHRINYRNIKIKERNVAPFLTEGQCSPSTEWRTIIHDLKSIIKPI